MKLNLLAITVAMQVVLVLYHQITTLFDFFPFNGARHYKWWEKTAECGLNGILMGLPPIGFAFGNHGLMKYGVVYYFILFAIELVTWWVPYFRGPSKAWREAYDRLHSRTVIVLPARGDNPVPNLEHTILHGWTLLTALVTLYAYLHPAIP